MDAGDFLSNLFYWHIGILFHHNLDVTVAVTLEIDTAVLAVVDIKDVVVFVLLLATAVEVARGILFRAAGYYVETSFDAAIPYFILLATTRKDAFTRYKCSGYRSGHLHLSFRSWMQGL